jgi:hypothetical protein
MGVRFGRAGSEDEAKRIQRNRKRARLKKSTRGPNLIGFRLLGPGSYLGRNECTCSSLDSLYLGFMVNWAGSWR